jgi:prephenate dehydrogenase
MPESRRQLPVLPRRSTGTTPPFDRIAIVGLGLIGGSIALAARKAWPQALVIGVDRNMVLEQAIVRHAIDIASEDLMIISEADLVVLAAPVGEILRLLPQLAGHVVTSAVVTDVGSTKRAIIQAAHDLPERLPFVGGHPLAGAARGGFEAARPDLFAGRPWLLVAGADKESGTTARLTAFVEKLGAKPVALASAAEHDRTLAFLSHLPQLVVSTLMSVVGQGVGEAGLELAGRGLVDTTRLASSPADIWRDICETNADEIGPALDALVAALQQVRRHLTDGQEIDTLFASANEWRERLASGRS